jgi:hypothetical protein
MLLNTTFNNISIISWRSVVLVEETGVPGKNHWPVASHWQALSHNVVSSIINYFALVFIQGRTKTNMRKYESLGDIHCTSTCKCADVNILTILIICATTMQKIKKTKTIKVFLLSCYLFRNEKLSWQERWSHLRGTKLSWQERWSHLRGQNCPDKRGGLPWELLKSAHLHVEVQCMSPRDSYFRMFVLVRPCIKTSAK